MNLYGYSKQPIIVPIIRIQLIVLFVKHKKGKYYEMINDIILNFITTHYGESTAVIFVVICAILEKLEKVPDKYSPFSIFFGWIGEMINRGTNEKLDNVDQKFVKCETQLNTVERDNDIRAMNHCKSEILSFSRSLKEFDNDDLVNIKDSFDEEDFNHIFDDYNDYEFLVEKTGLTNGKINRAMQRINRHSEAHGFGVVVIK